LTYRNLLDILTTHHDANEAKAIAFALLEDAYGLTRTDVLLGKTEMLNEEEQHQLKLMAERLAKGEPMQYVVGKARFGDTYFNVTPATLIPRPETLELVEWVATEEKERTDLSILDIGTGSGCIAISLAQRLPHAKVEAWDISTEALHVAQGNATQLGVSITFQKQNILQPIHTSSRFTTIVSNPPYICQKERAEMEHHVLDHEPHLALFVPDDDPLLFYRAIAQRGQELLTNGGCIYVEINRAYGAETCELFKTMGYTNITLRKDEFGNDRMVRACLWKNEEH
jgi:release factor glutamine methyltransferase